MYIEYMDMELLVNLIMCVCVLYNFCFFNDDFDDGYFLDDDDDGDGGIDDGYGVGGFGVLVVV